jgi:hypothetical protein
MTPLGAGGAVSASELGGVALHLLLNLEARTVAEGRRGSKRGGSGYEGAFGKVLVWRECIGWRGRVTLGPGWVCVVSRLRADLGPAVQS